MKLEKRFPSAAIAAALSAIFTASSAGAFSTGGHFRATEEGLRASGLGQHAVDLVQIANFQTDYIVNKPTSLEAARAEKVGHVAQYFHFDDLDSTAALERNLAWIEIAAQRMALAGKNANDPEKSLNGLGIVLHALQDVYSHSNLADKNWPWLVGQHVVTFDDLPQDLWKSPALRDTFDPNAAKAGVFTGNASSSTLYGTQSLAIWPEHGGDTFCDGTALLCGLNHDSVHRRNALVAQEMAIRATTQMAAKFRAWVGEPLWAQMKAYSGSFVNDCLGKMQQTASSAGQWAYPTSPGGWSRDSKMIDWALFGDGCSWDWQDTRWSNVLLDAFEAIVPDHFVEGDAVYPPASRPAFTIPSATPLPSVYFAGTYDVTWGSQAGTLTLDATGSAIHATLVVGGVARDLGAAVANGSALDLAGSGLSATIHLMAQTQDAVAGFVRNEQGIPNGIFGTKRPIVINQIDLRPIDLEETKHL